MFDTRRKLSTWVFTPNFIIIYSTFLKTVQRMGFKISVGRLVSFQNIYSIINIHNLLVNVTEYLIINSFDTKFRETLFFSSFLQLSGSFISLWQTFIYFFMMSRMLSARDGRLETYWLMAVLARFVGLRRGILWPSCSVRPFSWIMIYFVGMSMKAPHVLLTYFLCIIFSIHHIIFY